MDRKVKQGIYIIQVLRRAIGTLGIDTVDR